MYNLLFTNAGRRATLLKDFKASLGNDCKVVATDNWSVAPALFMADKYYIAPKITEDGYIDFLLDVCRKEEINAITSLIDPEIELLAKNKKLFEELGVIVLAPDAKTAELCFDKYEMFLYLDKNGIKTVKTYQSLDDFEADYKSNLISFPVFIKPRTGSGSVGAQKIEDWETLEVTIKEGKHNYIIQEYMNCLDFDADVYIDTITHEAVSAFSKKKIETRIGGASKTISFVDDKLFDFIKQIVKLFNFNGAVDMDFFYKDGTYYLSEINPRFGGAYLHAYGAGVDFPKYIANNIEGKVNEADFGSYDEDVLMLMYDEVVITKVSELKDDYNK